MITKLKKLWKQAFGDTDAFIDAFFSVAYSPDRCRYLTEDGELAAMLYWFDCEFQGKKLAYLYAVATDEAYRGQGFCRRLMEKTHRHLAEKGYAGAILVPAEDLSGLYKKLGYRTCSFVTNITCDSGDPVALRPITAEEYAALRRQYLPENGVIQEGAALALLAKTSRFYAGNGFVLTANTEDSTAYVHELLGSADPAGITAALGAQKGTFRVPGEHTPFAMFLSLDGTPAPGYFGLALD